MCGCDELGKDPSKLRRCFWYDLRSAAFPRLARSFRAASKNFFPCLPLERECAWAAPNFVQCFELEIRKQFWLQVVHNRKIRWKWYINARILFVGCIKVHSLRVWLCSWWGGSWSSRYVDFSNVNTAVSAAGFTWDSVGQGCLLDHLDYVTWSEMQKLWNYLIVKAVEQQKFSWSEILILFSGMF